MNLFLFVFIIGNIFMDNAVKAQDGIIYFMDNDSEEQSCKIANSNAIGKCLPIENCTTLNPSMIQTATFCPRVVRYLPKQVCCPEIQTISNSSSRITSRISQQKCAEYKNIGNDVGSFRTARLNRLGEGRVEPQVVGGVDVLPAEYPHMAAIGWTSVDNLINWNCGGTLISDSFVITAAHCSTDRENIAPDVVRISEHNLRLTKLRNVQQFNITKIIRHPSYNFSSVYDDIALVKLSGKVIFSYSAKPACLWSTFNIDQNTAVATGWGSTGYLEDFADILQKVTLNIITNEQCQTFLKPQKKFIDGLQATQMCAGDLSGGKDTCQGDSGGPLQIKTIADGVHYIIGITSFGKFCASPDSPGVYTRISSYIDWIESIVWSPQ